MKLSVTQENLSKALGVVGRVASGKTPLPILNNILLRTDNNRLLMAATNLEIAITHHIGARVESNGAITVPARLMSEFISNLPRGTVDLQADGTKLHISSGSYKSTIHGISSEDFPELPTISSETTYTLAAGILKRAIQQTVLVASRDDTRPVLTGVYCHTHEGKLYFAATDGYRLAERELLQVKSELAAIIPAQTLQDVLRTLSDDISEITLLLDPNQVRFLFGDIEITSRLIEGNFPDYRKMIPMSTEFHAELDKDEFIRVTKIASLFARESGGSVTLKTDSASKSLSVHSVASQLGENTSTIETDVDGDGQVTLNSRYLLEGLACIDDQSVTFAFSGKLSPCVLKAGSEKSKSAYTHIIMPLKS